MNSVKDAGHEGAPAAVDYGNPSQAVMVREMLARAGLSQNGAARELEIGERTMRRYCANEPVPRIVMLALERLVDTRRTLAAYEDGHIIGTRTGPQMATQQDHDDQVRELREKVEKLERQLAKRVAKFG